MFVVDLCVIGVFHLIDPLVWASGSAVMESIINSTFGCQAEIHSHKPAYETHEKVYRYRINENFEKHLTEALCIRFHRVEAM
jgi:hypothetical protein